MYYYRIYICFRPFSLKLALNTHAIIFSHANHSKIFTNTRGSNFWSSKVCEGGSHVNHMHANSLLIYPNFSSKLMITWLNFLNFLENRLLIRFQTDLKLTFDPLRTNEFSQFRPRKKNDLKNLRERISKILITVNQQ